MLWRSVSILSVPLLVALGYPLPAAPPDPKGVEFFETRIRPVLIKHCLPCHSAQVKKAKGGLLLDNRPGLLRGGDNGPALVPGDAAKSLLIQAIRHESLKMPPKSKLPDAVIADFITWVKRGAPDPRDTRSPHETNKHSVNLEEGRKFWAFQSPRLHPRPSIRKTHWPQRELDYFILAAQEHRGLHPVRAAGKQELIRRATFDLIGLPPTPEEIDAFEKDKTPGAFARVVDRLLQSPHYGERWARYWLDLARYADDGVGGTLMPIVNAYHYRDWVIRAINRDMPYDQFIRLQLAGDEIPEPAADYYERLGGLGFQGLGPQFNSDGQVDAKAKADTLEDRVDTLSRGLLGLTVSCARCHDHKYDPIPTRDYYSLAAAYNGAEWSERYLASPQEIKKKGTVVPRSPSVSGGGQAMRVFVRGNPEQLGEAAPPGFLRILRNPEGNEKNTEGKKRFTRLDLADAIVTRKNPLTARVFVNRVWHYHFGRGIVGTLGNFGQLGDRPTHPELLDTLAVRFMESGWSVKRLHREIMLSSAYQLGSNVDAGNAAKDADNHFLWRMTPRRLDFEAWRDAMLAVVGKLDPRVGGPSLDKKNDALHDKLVDDQGNTARLVGFDADDPTHGRRTVYCIVSRFAFNPTLAMFDFPEPTVASDSRNVTSIPQQQLFVLNSAFMIEMARTFARRLEKGTPSYEARIQLAWRLAYGRPATPRETTRCLEFLRAAGRTSADKITPWEQLGQVILSSNEFTFLP